MTNIANKVVRKLGLKQTPGTIVMKDFAKRARELQGQGHTADQAAIKAAMEKFPAEFVPTGYAHQGDGVDALLADIEKL